MAVRADAITTLTNLKSALNITASDKDTILTNIIDRTTWWIEERCNRKFNAGKMGGFKTRLYNGASGTHGDTSVAGEDYIYFSGTTRDLGGDTLIDERGFGYFYLPAYPVRANDETNSVTFGLHVLSDRGSNISGGETWDTTDLVEWDDFIIERENGILRLLNGIFSRGYRNYRVTMAAGYLFGVAEPYVPPDLEGACIELCKQVYKDNRNVTSESIGTWRRTFDRTLKDPYTEQVLDKYTRL